MLHHLTKRKFATPYVYKGILAGKSEGLINAPISAVWHKTQNFNDLSWLDTDLEVTMLPGT